MLKGAHKQMIVVRTRDSRLFEEAHFVMRRGAAEAPGDDLDLVFEANRIIENSLPRDGGAAGGLPQRRSGEVHPGGHGSVTWRESGVGLAVGLFWFILGLISGGGLVGLLWWIL